MAQDSAESLEWHLRRAPELEAIMDERGIGDLVVDVGDRGPAAIAGEIALKLGLVPFGESEH